jgi:hypothetical protein
MVTITGFVSSFFARELARFSFFSFITPLRGLAPNHQHTLKNSAWQFLWSSCGSMEPISQAVQMIACDKRTNLSCPGSKRVIPAVKKPTVKASAPRDGTAD